jgi:hypothetical protein
MPGNLVMEPENQNGASPKLMSRPAHVSAFPPADPIWPRYTILSGYPATIADQHNIVNRHMLLVMSLHEVATYPAL